MLMIMKIIIVTIIRIMKRRIRVLLITLLLQAYISLKKLFFQVLVSNKYLKLMTGLTFGSML